MKKSKSKVAKKRAVKKDPFNRREKSAKYKKAAAENAINNLEKLAKQSRIFLNRAKYPFETGVDNGLFSYDKLQEILYKVDIISGAYEMGMEPAIGKTGFTDQQLEDIENEWAYETREESHKSLRGLLGALSDFETALTDAQHALRQMKEDYVADSWKVDGQEVEKNTTLIYAYNKDVN